MPLYLPTNAVFHWEAVASRDGFGAPAYSTSGTYMRGFLTEDKNYSRNPKGSASSGKNESNIRADILITGVNYNILGGDKIISGGVSFDVERVTIRKDINGNFSHVEHQLTERV